MASSARPTPSRARARALLRAGLTLTAAGAALVAGGAQAASAANSSTQPDKVRVRTPLKALDTTMVKGKGIDGPPALHYAIGPLRNLRTNPMANTPVNPLSNTVGTQVSDFKPVSSGAVTGPVARGNSVGQLPVVGDAVGLLP
ncbi:hypothetical protein [Streptomyces palmae]|uniref:ATP-binding protein n=1 Tax=Streptomyces palmae TaxID=1701085 RepID=A0A4Z0H627_9ACTN|nr:hypothetical protein [Streptomyces palmae]TGB07853.1 hypothetical protein E4099_16450 [Streptomyces palmae]